MLWAGGMVWRSPVIDIKTVIVAVIAGAIVGCLMSWLLGQFSGRLRG